jgi:hypothetical protein
MANSAASVGEHSQFMLQLIKLVEYAEKRNLDVAALALGAAAEVIAPTLHATASPNAETSNTIYVDFRAGVGRVAW